MTDKTKGFDLARINTTTASDAGFEIEIVHPVTREGTGAFISLVGKDSTIFRDHVRRTANARIAKQAAQGRRGKDAEVPTVEKIEADAIDLLAACTTGWRGVVYNGVELPFSTVNAKVLYTDLIPVREQVDEAIGDIENFMKA